MEHLITTSKSVAEIADEFESGNIAVPEIQRDIVWNSDQIKRLVDSIANGFPCGALIYWEPREKDKQIVRSMIRPERQAAASKGVPRYFLLDGQQRVTALASVLLERSRLRTLLAEVQDDLPYVFISMKTCELQATNDPGSYKYPWIVFHKLFDGSYQNDKAGNSLPPTSIVKMQKYVQRLRDYTFPVQIIRDQNYSAVGEIFTRVNSAGTQLTGAEIHLARIVPHWNGITREFRQYRRELAQKNYDLDLTFLMRSITVVKCDVPQIKKLADVIARDKPSRGHLNGQWRQARGAIDRTIRILQRELGLDKSKYVTSKNALMPLVYLLAKVKTVGRLQRNAVRFFILAQLAEHYGGSGETTLRKDFRALTDSSRSVKDGLSDLLATVNREARQEYRGLNIRPDDVWGWASKNVLILLMYILMRERDATDWGVGKQPRLDDIEPRNMQLHHIFPFDYMTKNKDAMQHYVDVGMTPSEFRNDVNDIANLTFVSQTTNSALSENPPSSYLKTSTTKEIRRAHFIPEDESLWKASQFNRFLEERRRLLAKAMTRFLKKL
jgi:hypothetical protein